MEPLADASILRFEGHASVFLPYDGPCYRCLFPEPPPPDLAPSCGEAGVLGVLCGVMGNIQANEAIKVILGIGDTLSGRLLVYDALGMSFTELRSAATRTARGAVLTRTWSFGTTTPGAPESAATWARFRREHGPRSSRAARRRRRRP